MALTTASLKAGFARIAAGAEACAEELNAADGQLGDGDLGITLTRAGRGVAAMLDDLPDDLGQAFMKAAQAITKAASSSYGTLMATALMAAAKASKGKTELDWTEVSGLIDQALAAMQLRGKASLGDKTVLDAVAAARDATAGIGDPIELQTAAEASARQTLDDFRDRPNKIGRARIFAEKSMGLDDPGMLAFLRIVEALKG